MKKKTKKEQERFYRNVGQAVCNVFKAFTFYSVLIAACVLAETVNVMQAIMILILTVLINKIAEKRR